MRVTVLQVDDRLGAGEHRGVAPAAEEGERAGRQAQSADGQPDLDAAIVHA